MNCSVSLYSQSSIITAISQEKEYLKTRSDDLQYGPNNMYVNTITEYCRHFMKIALYEHIRKHHWSWQDKPTTQPFCIVKLYTRLNPQLSHGIMLWPKWSWRKFWASCETQSAKVFLYIPDMDMWERQQTALTMPPKLQNLGMSAS
jgi:hypothetical protein